MPGIIIVLGIQREETEHLLSSSSEPKRGRRAEDFKALITAMTTK